jgi:hypothetical protein
MPPPAWAQTVQLRSSFRFDSHPVCNVVPLYLCLSVRLSRCPSGRLAGSRSARTHVRLAFCLAHCLPGCLPVPLAHSLTYWLTRWRYGCLSACLPVPMPPCN